MSNACISSPSATAAFALHRRPRGSPKNGESKFTFVRLESGHEREGRKRHSSRTRHRRPAQGRRPLADLSLDEPFDPRDLDYFPPGNGQRAKQDTLAATALTPIVLRVFNPADWEGVKAPARLWIVPDYILDRTVTMLYADGGTGKSYLKLQLAVARALGKEWIGLMPVAGRTLVFSTEDDADEMHQRIEGMLHFFGARMADLGDIRLVDLVGENSVLNLLTKGIIEPTPMYDALDSLMAEFKPGLVCLDVLADMFSGSENDRPQVTQFVGLLKKLCRKHQCAVLLLAQPSVVGMSTGTGTSGSVGWGNSGRSRLYFQRAKTTDGDEPNKNLSTFEGKKANYSEVGGKFDVEWKDGLFRRVIGPSSFDKMAADAKAEDLFLSQLKRFTADGRNVSDSPGPNYAPAMFSSLPTTREALRGAMERLFEKKTIRVKTGGSASRPTKRITLI